MSLTCASPLERASCVGRLLAAGGGQTAASSLPARPAQLGRPRVQSSPAACGRTPRPPRPRRVGLGVGAAARAKLHLFELRARLRQVRFEPVRPAWPCSPPATASSSAALRLGATAPPLAHDERGRVDAVRRPGSRQAVPARQLAGVHAFPPDLLLQLPGARLGLRYGRRDALVQLGGQRLLARAGLVPLALQRAQVVHGQLQSSARPTSGGEPLVGPARASPCAPAGPAAAPLLPPHRARGPSAGPCWPACARSSPCAACA